MKKTRAQLETRISELERRVSELEDSRTVRAEVFSAIREIEQKTIASVLDLTRRGGPARRAVRG